MVLTIVPHPGLVLIAHVCAMARTVLSRGLDNILRSANRYGTTYQVAVFLEVGDKTLEPKVLDTPRILRITRQCGFGVIRAPTLAHPSLLCGLPEKVHKLAVSIISIMQATLERPRISETTQERIWLNFTEATACLNLRLNRCSAPFE